MTMISLMMLLGAFFICAVFYIGCQASKARYIDEVSGILDQLIAKKKIIGQDDMLETRESKLVHQVNRIVAMLDQDIYKISAEKEVIKKLIGDLSHQLKTPLANMNMYIELLEDSNLSKEERKEFLGRTKEQTEKMQWLMEDLFKMSLLETGVLEFQPEPKSIKKTIASAISTVYGQAVEKNIVIEMDEFEDRQLYHHPKWTAEAMTNVLDNAIKYSTPHSKIKIQITTLEIYSRISFTDEGVGIDKEEFTQIFNRFYRSPKVAEVKGMGIGLYLAQNIMRQQGGYIIVESEKNIGSTFSLFLQNCHN